MKHTVHTVNGKSITEVRENFTVNTAQQFLSIMVNSPSDRILLHKKHVDESFFDLRSGLAGEVLQKVSNYSRRLGIVGDFSSYESKSLHAFIYESNKSNKVVFVNSVEEALQRLSV